MTGYRLTLLFAPLVLMLALSGQVWCATDDADTTLTIAAYLDVQVGPIGPAGWGRGLTTDKQAVPDTTAGDGTTPPWSGGGLADVWPWDTFMPYCHGATNRAPITVSSNLGSVYMSVPFVDPDTGDAWRLWQGAKVTSASLRASMARCTRSPGGVSSTCAQRVSKSAGPRVSAR